MSEPGRKRKKAVAEPRQQYAALPWRKGAAGVEIMLVSSRETRRWVIPKGWPIKGHRPSDTALVEAMEEAGLVGEIAEQPIGHYHYKKRRKNGAVVPCRVDVFPLGVLRQRESWPEKSERTTRWFGQAEAAEAVVEEELGALIRGFAP